MDALGGDTPPPAWIETRRGSAWLGYGSYCWRGTCADFMRPECGDGHTPTVHAVPGEVATFHLPFRTNTVLLDHLTSVEGADASGDRERLEPGRDVEWHVTREGPLSLSTWFPNGDASYTACLQFAPAPLTVEEALARGSGDVAVRGTLYVDGDETRLCGTLAESYPPQCPQESLVVVGADLPRARLRREGEVAWSAEPLTLVGTFDGATLVVSG